MRLSIIAPLFVVILIAVLSQLYLLSELTPSSVLINHETTVSNPIVDNVQNFLTAGIFKTNLLGITVAFNLGAGALVLIISSFIIVIASAIELSAEPLGVGGAFHLSGFGAQALMVGVMFYGLWLVFSVLATPMFFGFPFFGIPLYFVLSLVYVLGVFESMRTGSSD